MDRREFLRKSALAGAGVTVGSLTSPLWLPPEHAEAARRVQWGALALPKAGQDDQLQAVKHLEKKLGRRFDTTHHRMRWEVPLVNSFTKWSDKTGHKLILSWFTRKQGGGMVSWSSIANGDHDAWITRQARSVKNAGFSGYFAFHKEPEDEGQPEDWKAAFDRVHRIFDNVGVRRFWWVACLMASTFDAGEAGKWLPKRYGLLGVDGYNRYRCADRPWKSFREKFRSAHRFATNKGKKLYVIEYGSVEGEPGRKADWIDGARRTVRRWPEIVGVSYNHESTDCVYWVDSSYASFRAFRRMGRDRLFS